MMTLLLGGRGGGGGGDKSGLEAAMFWGLSFRIRGFLAYSAGLKPPTRPKTQRTRLLAVVEVVVIIVVVVVVVVVAAKVVVAQETPPQFLKTQDPQ